MGALGLTATAPNPSHEKKRRHRSRIDPDQLTGLHERPTVWATPRVKIIGARFPSPRRLRMMAGAYFALGLFMLAMGVGILFMEPRSVTAATGASSTTSTVVTSTAHAATPISPVYVAAAFFAGVLFLSMGHLYLNMRDVSRLQVRLVQTSATAAGDPPV